MIKWNNTRLIKWAVSSTPCHYKQNSNSATSLTSAACKKPVISNDITLPRKSRLFSPAGSSSAVSQMWPLHMQMHTKPILLIILRHPLLPTTGRLLSASLLLSVHLFMLQSVLATHCLLVGTLPILAQSQTCSATLDGQNTSSPLSILEFPMHPFIKMPAALSSVFFFSAPQLRSTLWKNALQPAREKIMLALQHYCEGTNKVLNHLNALLLCNHSKGKTKSSTNNVTSSHLKWYPVYTSRMIIR